jgi:membrane-bound lytic murein transglycosylase D
MRTSFFRFRLLCGAPLALVLALALSLALSGCVPSNPSQPSQANAPQATAPPLPAPVPVQPSQPAAAKAPPPPAAQQQRIRALIQQVESAYKAGESDYHKGQLPEAKMNFDRAIDLMLSSGVDIKSIPELQDEFDRIVDGVNAMEMEALKQGNGFVPKVEETPADVASDVTFEVDPNLAAKVKNELATTKSDLPLMVNEYVLGFINFFANSQKGHNTLLHSFERSGRYRAMIQKVMSEEGVPQDLIYLAVAESGFQPQAVNRRSRAGGMWQFMPVGNYGLTRNAYVDERFDPEKSTRAYARYMKFLYNQLGDWYLAMAAYDWGAGNIQRAVQKTGYADFWELYKRNNLPGETKNYVPEILAAIIIANNPHQYGFDDVPLDPPVLTDTVTINYSVDLRLVSDLLDTPVDELMALNPAMLKMTTPPDASFDLHLPAGTASLLEDRIAQIPEARRNSWRYHRVAAGDTLASVARTYHVSESDLAAANQLGAGTSLQGAEALVVPVPLAATPSLHASFYTARRGDTLVTIADRFGVSLEQLRRWNQISGIKVEPGRRLHIAEPAHVAQSAARHSPTSKASGSKPRQASAATAAAQKAATASTAKKSAASSAKRRRPRKPAAVAKSSAQH